MCVHKCPYPTPQFPASYAHYLYATVAARTSTFYWLSEPRSEPRTWLSDDDFFNPIGYCSSNAGTIKKMVADDTSHLFRASLKNVLLILIFFTQGWGSRPYLFCYSASRTAVSTHLLSEVLVRGISVVYSSINQVVRVIFICKKSTINTSHDDRSRSISIQVYYPDQPLTTAVALNVSIILYCWNSSIFIRHTSTGAYIYMVELS